MQFPIYYQELTTTLSDWFREFLCDHWEAGLLLDRELFIAGQGLLNNCLVDWLDDVWDISGDWELGGNARWLDYRIAVAWLAYLLLVAYQVRAQVSKRNITENKNLVLIVLYVRQS